MSQQDMCCIELEPAITSWSGLVLLPLRKLGGMHRCQSVVSLGQGCSGSGGWYPCKLYNLIQEPTHPYIGTNRSGIGFTSRSRPRIERPTGDSDHEFVDLRARPSAGDQPPEHPCWYLARAVHAMTPFEAQHEGMLGIFRRVRERVRV